MTTYEDVRREREQVSWAWKHKPEPAPKRVLRPREILELMTLEEARDGHSRTKLKAKRFMQKLHEDYLWRQRFLQATWK